MVLFPVTALSLILISLFIHVEETNGGAISSGRSSRKLGGRQIHLKGGGCLRSVRESGGRVNIISPEIYPSTSCGRNPSFLWTVQGTTIKDGTGRCLDCWDSEVNCVIKSTDTCWGGLNQSWNLRSQGAYFSIYSRMYKDRCITKVNDISGGVKGFKLERCRDGKKNQLFYY